MPSRWRKSIVKIVRRRGLAEDDVLDFELGHFLAMAVFHAGAFAALHLEDDELRAAEVLFDFEFDGAGDGGFADVDLTIVRGHEDAVFEVDDIADVGGDSVDVEDGTDFDFILLAAGFDDGVHVLDSAFSNVCCP